MEHERTIADLGQCETLRDNEIRRETMWDEKRDHVRRREKMWNDMTRFETKGEMRDDARQRETIWDEMEWRETKKDDLKPRETMRGDMRCSLALRRKKTTRDLGHRETNTANVRCSGTSNFRNKFGWIVGRTFQGIIRASWRNHPKTFWISRGLCHRAWKALFVDLLILA